ncbi:uroporphyrinogen-III synthase [Actinotalea sp.]|uniref:uroporphyrinogen-III synthase n=1 Tax=Actinotalea sp. TaxID=1872145 RepID=UPI003567D3EF
MRARGAVPVVLPLVEFAPAADLGALDRALDDLAAGRYDWLAVTSATTVDAIAERVVHRGLGPLAALLVAGPRSEGRDGPVRVAAVGPATARALDEQGITPALVSTERSAAGLAAELAPLTGPGTATRRLSVLVPHSDIAEATLTEGLREVGWDAQEVVAYRTVTGTGDPVAAAHRWSVDGRHAVLLTSPSTARAVVDRLGRPPAGVVLCALGPRTAEYARRQGLEVTVVAEEPGVTELVLALVEHARSTSQDPSPHPSRQEAPE